MGAIKTVYAKAPHLGSTVARLKPKGLDGIPNKQWSMWFNAMIRAESYQSLRIEESSSLVELRLCLSGVAWLSTARAVRCSPFINFEEA